MHEIPDLVERVIKKDMLAMKLLYDRSAKAMLNLSMRITQNRAESQDILQESYLTSFQKIKTLDDPKRYFAWLKRIVVNNSLSATKGKRYYEEITTVAGQIEIEDEVEWYENIDFSMVKKEIDQLPEGCREIFSLYLLEGYKHREIANFLGISESTSKSQYQYALKLLKQNLHHFKARYK